MDSFDQLCFLLADDDEDQICLMKNALSKAGVTNPLRVVTNGDEVIAYLSGGGPFRDRVEHPLPFVLLLDLKMPGKDGFEVLEWMRNQPNLRNLVRVILTNSNLAADADRAHKLGAHYYLTKPGSFDQLVEMARSLRAWLRANHFPPG